MVDKNANNAAVQPKATPETIEWLKGRILDLGRQIEPIVAKRRVLQEELAAVQSKVVTIGSGEASGSQNGNLEGPVSPRSPQSVPQDIDLSGLDADLLNGIDTALDRVIRVAITVGQEGKFLNITQLAHYFRRTGVTDAKVQNLRTTIGRVFDRHPELFEKVRGATYRYMGSPDEQEPD